MMAGKRKEREQQEAGAAGGGKKPNAMLGRSCVHEVAVPTGFIAQLDEAVHGSIGEPVFMGDRAKSYPFELDPFQQISIACLERKESLLVSAHTSAGKTAVAEYAIAMAFRDKQRVIYTSPLKALSNQKYRELSHEFSDVGLMTGDVSLSPNATCIVMTTEILRGMLYRGSEVLREVAWVVFDEIHYMRDRERGVVWEESIILLPPAIKMVFLSATMSNATEFAQWICHLHKQPCHVVYTDFRPTPLQHYAFAMGGSGLYLMVDDKGHFRDDNFAKLQQSSRNAGPDDSLAPPGRRRGGGGRRGGGRGGAKASAGVSTDIYKIVKMIMERSMQPVIVFSFSRRECEQYALSVSKLDFNSDQEKMDVEHVFSNAIQCLSEEDRSLPPIHQLLPLLKRGVAFHHSGLLPILKEIVEILFQEGLVKALFATETFAMGLNMPAKTVVFTALRKWDGDAHRYMSSGEYIQMSGRAGRRGKDERGICIIMIDDQMDVSTCREMILGKPAPLVSTFRLSYYSLLNLMSRAEGHFDMEYVMKHSFHQFQHEKNVPEMENRINKLEQEAALLDAAGEETVAEYHRLRLKLAELERQLMSEIIRPDRIIVFLQPGRLVKVRDGADDWGWGVVINVVKKPTPGGPLPSTIVAAPRAASYLVDTLLLCAPGMELDGSRLKPRPCSPGQKGEMHVVPVQMTLLCAISTLRVAVPTDLRPADARLSVLMAMQELERRFPDGLPRLDPVEDMQIDDPELVSIVKQIDEEEKKLVVHPLHKSEKEASHYSAFQKKAELLTEAQRLRSRLRDSQLHKFREELRNRTRVLKRLGHINELSVVQLKGRAACLIDTADELLVAELIFEGLFNDLDHHQIVALSSCFLPIEKSNEQIHLKAELAWPFRRLQDTARMIAEVERECKLETEVEHYVEKFQPYLMDVIYSWSKGSSFAEICEMTDIFEGSIIRVARRLEEFLNQLRLVFQAIGNGELEKKFEAGIESIRRGIMFANSLYL
ncbi:DExH-box ATP-dependent RNA helicase DExH10 [Selaginella moellendorffii]|nr:DExH-box ATP-dependent RNA helicase DExH10 [Selaginella moellendorffii]|eukprot:XP_002963518.2 DExH-box ATP-dependent RNA helicase DExH10 [Selaginella moellendorffii]